MNELHAQIGLLAVLDDLARRDDRRPPRPTPWRSRPPWWAGLFGRRLRLG